MYYKKKVEENWNICTLHHCRIVCDFQQSLRVTEGLCAPTPPFAAVSANEWGVPRGVEEAVPRDAVSRCGWRNEPESRRAAPINLPLKAIVAVWGGTTNTENGVLLRFSIIYLKYQIQLHSSNSITHAASACLLWIEVRGNFSQLTLFFKFDVLCIELLKQSRHRVCLRKP